MYPRARDRKETRICSVMRRLDIKLRFRRGFEIARNEVQVIDKRDSFAGICADQRRRPWPMAHLFSCLGQ